MRSLQLWQIWTRGWGPREALANVKNMGQRETKNEGPFRLPWKVCGTTRGGVWGTRITLKNGKRLYAATYGLKAFRLKVRKKQ